MQQLCSDEEVGNSHVQVHVCHPICPWLQRIDRCVWLRLCERYWPDFGGSEVRGKGLQVGHPVRSIGRRQNATICDIYLRSSQRSLVLEKLATYISTSICNKVAQDAGIYELARTDWGCFVLGCIGELSDDDSYRFERDPTKYHMQP